MQSLRVLLLASATVVVSSTQVTPVQKVVAMMTDMKNKGIAEMEDEQVQYAKFKQFCDMTLDDKAKAIATATQTMEVLEADAQKATNEAKSLENEVKVHNANAEKSGAEQEKATKLRESERADFQVTLKDYTESIDALGRALKALRKEDYTRKQAETAGVEVVETKALSLMQLSQLKLIPEETKRSINALLMEAKGTPAAKGYEFQSGGVIEMLEELENKFLDERDALNKEETSRKHSYEMLMQGLKAEQDFNKKAASNKDETKGKKLQAAANAKVDFQETSAARAADQKYRDDLDNTCKKKAGAFDERQKTRSEEIEALSKAIDIISSGAVAGSAQKHLPTLMQTRRGKSALVSLRATAGSPAVQVEVVKFLQNEADSLKSNTLSLLVQRIGAPDLSAIKNVKNLIENLIAKLNKQGEDEAAKKAYCDAELKTNSETRSEKTDVIEKLQANMDQLTSSIAMLSKDVATCDKDIAKLTKDMQEATEIRRTEKNENEKTIREASAAQRAVANALTILRNFYEDASYATSFVQTASKTVSGQPDIFGDEPYKGQSSAKGGVVGLLEVIETDFARLEAVTTAQEAAAKKEYNEFMEDSNVDKSKKEREVDHKTNKKAEQQKEFNGVQADQLGTQKELDAAELYYEKLKPDCVDAGNAYKERAAMREQEIKALIMALEKLGGSMDEE